jgi:Tfp pilus assembly PilM family ATPase
MSVGRKLIAISLDQDRLCAVSAAVSSKTVKVEAMHSAQAPANVSVREGAAVGAWIGSELEKGGLGRGRLVIAVPRGEVILKKLKLPRAEGSTGAELAGMVRLQMTRQLTMAVEGTAIDYLPIGDLPQGSAGGTVSVLAAALPGERMLYYRELAKAAGCKIERLGLRSAGVASLLAEASQTANGPVLGVAVGIGSTEYAVVESGQLVFARAADIGLGAGDGDDSFIQKIAVEAKRTAMSYRVGEGAVEVDALLVAGDGGLAGQVSAACGEASELPARVSQWPSAIEVPGLVSERDRLVSAPLLGLLLEIAADRVSLDFAHPRKAP